MVDPSPLADGDYEGYMAEVAKLHEALGGEPANAAPAPPPAPPVLAGNPPLHQPSADERLAEVRDRAKAGDPGAWSEWFRLKQEQAVRAAGHIQ